jgi:RNA polymerase sigma-70 factor (ECF subfamily)
VQKAIENQIIALRGELVRYANRVTIGSTLDGEDLVHDVIVKVLKSERTFNESDNVRAYLYQAIRNTFINMNIREARKQNLAVVNSTADGNTSLSHDEAISNLLAVKSAEDEALFNDLSPELANALFLLDEGIRETFILITVKGLTYDECAKAQGIAMGTVMSRCNRAKKQLKAQLVGA